MVTRLTRLLAFLAMLSVLPAAAQDVTVMVGQEVLSLPTPPGMAETSEEFPLLLATATRNSPPKYRPVALFFTNKAIAQWREGKATESPYSLQVSVFKQTESGAIDRGQFADILEKMKNGMALLIADNAQTKKTVGYLHARDKGSNFADGELSRMLREPATFKASPTLPLGVYLERDGVLGLLSVIRSETQTAGQTTASLQALGAVHVLLQGKWLMAQFSTTYESNADLDWIKSASEDWVDNLAL